jgi:hypothetical protein
MQVVKSGQNYYKVVSGKKVRISKEKYLKAKSAAKK